jgi:hypothetical protein
LNAVRGGGEGGPWRPRLRFARQGAWKQALDSRDIEALAAA